MSLTLYTKQPLEEIEKLETGERSSYDTIKTVIEDTFDICTVDELDIYVDDCGLLKEMTPNIIVKRSNTPQITEYDTVLVGPVVFASHDGEGETISVTDEAKRIIENMKPVFLGTTLIHMIEAYE